MPRIQRTSSSLALLDNAGSTSVRSNLSPKHRGSFLRHFLPNQRMEGVRLFRSAAYVVIAARRFLSYVHGPAALNQREKTVVDDAFMKASPIATLRDLRAFLALVGCANVTDDALRQRYLKRTFGFDGSSRPMGAVEARRIVSQFKRDLFAAHTQQGSEDLADARSIIQAMQDSRSAKDQGEDGSDGAVTFGELQHLLGSFNISINAMVSPSAVSGGKGPVRFAPLPLSKSLSEADLTALLSDNLGRAHGRLSRSSNVTSDQRPSSGVGADVSLRDQVILNSPHTSTTSETDPHTTIGSGDNQSWIEAQAEALRAQLSDLVLPPPTDAKLPPQYQLLISRSDEQLPDAVMRHNIFPRIGPRAKGGYTLPEVCMIIDSHDRRSLEVTHLMKAPTSKSNVTFAGRIPLPKISGIDHLAPKKSPVTSDESSALSRTPSPQRRGFSKLSTTVPPATHGKAAPRQRHALPKLSRDPYSHVTSHGIDKLAHTPSFLLAPEVTAGIFLAALRSAKDQARPRGTTETVTSAASRSAAATLLRMIENRKAGTQHPDVHQTTPHQPTPPAAQTSPPQPTPLEDSVLAM